MTVVSVFLGVDRFVVIAADIVVVVVVAVFAVVIVVSPCRRCIVVVSSCVSPIDLIVYHLFAPPLPSRTCPQALLARAHLTPH